MVLRGDARTGRAGGAGGHDPFGAASGLFVGTHVNGLIGLVLLFLTNLFLADDIPINLLTVSVPEYRTT
jgi:hypothetical protein